MKSGEKPPSCEVDMGVQGSERLERLLERRREARLHVVCVIMERSLSTMQVVGVRKDFSVTWRGNEGVFGEVPRASLTVRLFGGESSKRGPCIVCTRRKLKIEKAARFDVTQGGSHEE